MQANHSVNNRSHQEIDGLAQIERDRSAEQTRKSRRIYKLYQKVCEEAMKHDKTIEFDLYKIAGISILSAIWVLRYLGTLLTEYQSTYENGINTSMSPAMFTRGIHLLEAFQASVKTTCYVTGTLLFLTYICALDCLSFIRNFTVTTSMCIAKTLFLIVQYSTAFYVTSFLLTFTSHWAFIFILSFFNITWLNLFITILTNIHKIVKENDQENENNQPETRKDRASMSEMIRSLPKMIPMIRYGIMPGPLALGLVGLLTIAILTIECNTVLIWGYIEATKPQLCYFTSFEIGCNA
ncbi:hypothetical protein NEHOM01_2035 [Nematocida homosporus]|uniref:uncharacterized protein n=1 Tax=Nematocida homosporus TaxID=1912981 RepID=UPI0022201334|nr:uncharacterized protein NEHOM01_2035 [Nematocida homosporus]KAI5187239.1 hypothetical protein NEHOM01_2035 [Nematocida homosporus]